ncbi:MAG: cysteine--tRNA ligase [Acholeplasmatales bacterium]|jgi:cysteinyl-tRNA synthetase|nr:cysteine--tRNA ligase [Acholeplasmatales bacterium]
MGLKIYNSVSKKIEDFVPINGKVVNIYVCGPTVYDDPHIGNMRPPVFFDTLRRYLIYKGYDVFYVTNITDVDDKIILRSKKENIDIKELTDYYTLHYFDLLDKLNCLKPSLTPRATMYIPDMIDFIERLIKEEYAYIKESGVYFRVSKIKDYGYLSNQKMDDLEEGVRIELKEKEDARDFALWKFDEKAPNYQAPFGDGRPGWHTECAVMNEKIFNQEIDIHGGGFDLKFPHHENEIAQTYALHAHHLAKYFMHVGRINFQGDKMSKSLGNVIKAKDAILKYGENVIRYFILYSFYRSIHNFDENTILFIDEEYKKLERTLTRKSFLLHVNNIKEVEVDKNIISKFEEIMDDDLNTPNVFSLLNEALKNINKSNDLLEVSKLYNSIFFILDILGIKVNINIEQSDIINYHKWSEFRINKDYANADIYRKLLLDKGLL